MRVTGTEKLSGIRLEFVCGRSSRYLGTPAAPASASAGLVSSFSPSPFSASAFSAAAFSAAFLALAASRSFRSASLRAFRSASFLAFASSAYE